MSTILKALQKVEPESFGLGATQTNSTHQDSEGRILGNMDSDMGLPPEREVDKNSWDHRSRLGGKGRNWVILILVLLAIVGLWRYLKPSGTVPEKKMVKTFPIPQKPETHQVPKQVKKGGASTLKPQSSPKSVAQNKAAKKPLPARSELPVAPSQKKASPIKPISDTRAKQTVNTEKRTPKTPPPASSPAAKKPENTDQPRSSKAVAAKPAEKKRAVSAPSARDQKKRWQDAKPLKHDRMLLQALAWSSEPGKRMAVIDGLVVREGDDANGFNVVAIEKKNIILKRDGENYRLEFKSK